MRSVRAWRARGPRNSTCVCLHAGPSFISRCHPGQRTHARARDAGVTTVRRPRVTQPSSSNGTCAMCAAPRASHIREVPLQVHQCVPRASRSRASGAGFVRCAGNAKKKALVQTSDVRCARGRARRTTLPTCVCLLGLLVSRLGPPAGDRNIAVCRPVLGAGCWALGAGCWVLGAGCCAQGADADAGC